MSINVAARGFASVGRAVSIPVKLTLSKGRAKNFIRVLIDEFNFVVGVFHGHNSIRNIGKYGARAMQWLSAKYGSLSNTGCQLRSASERERDGESRSQL
eukprot:COSAG06_NODE_22536_length_720_cov_1.241546_1_plen_98_part_10